MSDINIGQFSEALNDKMDRDAHNVQSPSAVIVEKQDPTSANNYTWYRKYSDGWVEQGGIKASATSVVFPVSFSDTNYVSVASPLTGAGNASLLGIYNRTTTGLYFTTSNNAFQCCWYACGIAAN